jgi:hypothetical protein
MPPSPPPPPPGSSPPPSPPPPSSWSPPPFLYREPRLENVEDVEEYVRGGYHPDDIGDVLGIDHKQYEVIHKLGSGGLSTVSLARSQEERPSYFCIKILRADVVGLGELHIYQQLKASAATEHPGVAFLHDSHSQSPALMANINVSYCQSLAPASTK